MKGRVKLDGRSSMFKAMVSYGFSFKYHSRIVHPFHPYFCTMAMLEGRNVEKMMVSLFILRMWQCLFAADETQLSDFKSVTVVYSHPTR